MEPVSSHTAASTIRGAIDYNNDNDGQKVRISGIVYKRRSGLGKYSMTAPWERRRVVLMGTRLIYYKTLQESQITNNANANAGSDGEHEDDEMSHSERSRDHDNSTPSLVYGGSATSDDVSANGWINSFMDKTGVSIPWESSSSSGFGSSAAARGARGYMDLRKEKASAAASYGHTGAPTPFALSIKVASTTKYKFCFDTQQELMQWLAAITDVVVGGSVDAYNAEILEANDPSSHGHHDAVSAIASASSGFSWHEASPRNSISASSAHASAHAVHEEGGGHQLWSTERYVVASEGLPGSISKAVNDEHNKSNKSGDSKQSSADNEEDVAVGASPEDYVVDASTGEQVLPFRPNIRNRPFI